MSKDLMDIEAQVAPPREQPDGTVVVEMKVAWSGANSLAQAMRYSAQQAADAFIDLFREESRSRGATTDAAGQSAPKL